LSWVDARGIARMGGQKFRRLVASDFRHPFPKAIADAGS
jgi:hypothetical protein